MRDKQLENILNGGKCAQRLRRCQGVVQEGGTKCLEYGITFDGKYSEFFAVTFSAFCTAAEGFQLNHSNYITSLSVVTVLFLGVLAIVAFLIFFTSLLRG